VNLKGKKIPQTKTSTATKRTRPKVVYILFTAVNTINK